MANQSMSQWDDANKNTTTVTGHNPTIDSQRKPILVLDFDGVIHSYEKGWQGGEIYGTVVEGFFAWAMEAKKYFDLHIYSSRSGSHKTRQPMQDWLAVHLDAWKWDRIEHGYDEAQPDLTMKDFTFVSFKPPAFVTIDDRAITFDGFWNHPKYYPETLLKFKSWVQK